MHHDVRHYFHISAYFSISMGTNVNVKEFPI